MSEGYMCDGGCDGPTCDGPSHRTPTPREQPPLTPEQVEEFARGLFLAARDWAAWEKEGPPIIQRIAQAAAQAERERCAAIADEFRVSREQGER